MNSLKNLRTIKLQQFVGTPQIRIKLLLVIFALILGIVFLRLFSWQVLDSESLAVIARSQHQSIKTIFAARGSIFAADGYPLSTTGENWLLWASLPNLTNRETVAKTLAPLLVPENEISVEQIAATGSSQVKTKTLEEQVSAEEARIKELLGRTVSVWVPIKHKITREVKEKIADLKIKGLGFDPEEDRAYPEASMAAHLLGFVGKDTVGENKGYFGLEGFYDLTLSGVSGEKAVEKDASGRPIILGLNKEISAVNGINLQTNINRSVQFILEAHLQDALQKYEAAQATAIIMDPQSGAVLASATIPSFEPSKYSSYPKERYTDGAIGESFEPGSIFKVVVMASALDAGAVVPETKCANCSGPRHIAEYTIESGTKKYHPETNMSEIILHSDNVGMIWVAEQLGFDRLYDYLTKFGIGSSTGIDLQGETVAPLRKKQDWTIVDTATSSFGQGIAVTPIQMVRAVAAIANGGRLPTPYVVNKIEGEGWEKEIKPDLSRTVISPGAAREVTEMMVGAVDSKAREWGKPEGFRIAGKTGTAQIPISGHYDANKTIHSFVGFAPADKARFAMIVTLKDPKSVQFASQSAAIVWFDITRDILPVLGIQPQ